MLNVHHLTYHNDNKPWQYGKEELQLLCKDCHAKRHGKLNTNIEYKNDDILTDKEDVNLDNNDVIIKCVVIIAIAIIVFIVLM